MAKRNTSTDGMGPFNSVIMQDIAFLFLTFQGNVTKRKYLDFLDILLDARVRRQYNLLSCTVMSVVIIDVLSSLTLPPDMG